MVSESIFVLSPDKSDELVSSLDGSNPEDTSASSSLVQSLVGQYKKALEKERTIFLIMLGLYGLVILFGLLALLWNESLGPRWRRKRSAPEFKEFHLEKHSENTEAMPMSRLRAGTAAKANQVSDKIGSLVASPLARLRHKKSIRRQAAGKVTFSNITPVDAVRASEMQQRTFSPPPAYPVPERTYWMQQPSTVSLLGALDLPDQTESQCQSRQSVASVQPSSAGVSPTTSGPTGRKGSKPADPSHIPPLPLLCLYGKPIESAVPPTRPPRPASHFNPFVTPFDGPNGL